MEDPQATDITKMGPKRKRHLFDIASPCHKAHTERAGELASEEVRGGNRGPAVETLVMRRLLVSLATSLLVVPFMPSLSEASQRTSHGCRRQATSIHAFTVEAKWRKRVFTNKETAAITLTVTRPAPEDPLQLGIPTDSPVSIPVEGATAWTTVLTERYPYPYGYGRTDADGKAKIKLALELLEKPGAYDVTHNAEVWTNQGGCPDIHEWGFLMESPGLTIRE